VDELAEAATYIAEVQRLGQSLADYLTAERIVGDPAELTQLFREVSGTLAEICAAQNQALALIVQHLQFGSE
jgi:hypothetical protein